MEQLGPVNVVFSTVPAPRSLCANRWPPVPGCSMFYPMSFFCPETPKPTYLPGKTDTALVQCLYWYVPLQGVDHSPFGPLWTAGDFCPAPWLLPWLSNSATNDLIVRLMSQLRPDDNGSNPKTQLPQKSLLALWVVVSEEPGLMFAHVFSSPALWVYSPGPLPIRGHRGRGVTWKQCRK